MGQHLVRQAARGLGRAAQEREYGEGVKRESIATTLIRS
jgi:hypothetical protein